MAFDNLDNPQVQRETIRQLVEHSKRTDAVFKELQTYTSELESVLRFLVDAMPVSEKEELLKFLNDRGVRTEGKAKFGKAIVPTGTVTTNLYWRLHNAITES